MDVREREEQRGKPAEGLISIPLSSDDPNKVTNIGALLPEPLKAEITKFLQENSDIFAWTAANMPGISPDLITHKLNIDSNRKTVQTEKKKFCPRKARSYKRRSGEIIESWVH